MKISRKSWHYKLHRYWMNGAWHKNITLCYYFWSLVGAVLKALLLLTLWAVILSLVGAFLYSIGQLIWQHPLLTAKLFGGMVAVLAILYSVLRLKRTVEYMDKSNSVILSYIAAKKKKYCPLVEFKD
jgi:membrane protein implicated in regulation of membrane protease activity